MPRFQTDDTFGDCLEARQAGTAALGLYYRCGLWSALHLSDGLIPSVVVADYGTTEWVRKLVDAGLFLVVEGGFLMPRYLGDNPSREKVLKQRAAKAVRQAKWLEAHRSPSSTPRRVSSRSNNASRDASVDVSVDATLPLPSPKGEGVGAAPLRGAPPPPTRTPNPSAHASSESRCDLHFQALPCRGCAADAKAGTPDGDLALDASLAAHPMTRRPSLESTTEGP